MSGASSPTEDEQNLIDTVTQLSAPAGAALAMHARMSPLLALYEAFYAEIMGFELSARFDAKASYTDRKARELDAIRHKYRTAIEHYKLAEHAP